MLLPVQFMQHHASNPGQTPICSCSYRNTLQSHPSNKLVHTSNVFIKFSSTTRHYRASRRQNKLHATVCEVDLKARRRQRVCEELASAGKSAGLKVSAESLDTGWATLEKLVPGFAVDLELLKAVDWAKVLSEPDAVAIRLISIKAAFPGLDLCIILAKYPRILLLPQEQLQKQLAKVQELLVDAKDASALLMELPQMLDPRSAVSILVTVQRWFPKKVPMEVLEADPDIIRRAQENDVPLEPVFFDENGNYAAPQHSRVVTEDWQAWVRTNVYKYKDVQKVDSEVVAQVRSEKSQGQGGKEQGRGLQAGDTGGEC